MSGSVKILSLVLVLQLALSTWVYTGQNELDSYVAKKELVSLAKDSINSVELVEAAKEEGDSKVKQKSLSLSKEGDIWNVKISNDLTFKALKSKVNRLLSSLTRIKTPLPVATSKISHKQLEVAKDNFTKKISLKSDENEEVILLGKSAGFKQVYLRKVSDDNSYSVEFDTYSLEFEPMKWIDTEVLVLDSGKIDKLNLPKVKLERKDDGFVISGGEKASLEKDKVNSIFKAIANLKIQAVVSNKKKGLKDLVNEIKFKYDGVDKAYSFYVNSGDEYNLTVENMPYIFTVAKAPIDKILGVKKEKLIKIEVKKVSK